MPKILITGNGFDLNLRLPTLYADFINIVKHITTNEDISFDTIYSLCTKKEHIKKEFENFEFDINKVNKLKELALENVWFNFFKNEYEIDTWIDFENRIEYALNNIFLSIEKIRDKVFVEGESIKKNHIRYPNAYLNNNFLLIKLLYSFKITKQTSGNYFIFNTSYLNKLNSYYTDINDQKICSFLSKELKKFKIIFNLYFEIFVLPLYSNSKQILKQTLFSKITHHYTFNYTPTFENIYEKEITQYLHGKINSVENRIVLGIDEIPNNIDNKLLLPFTKYFQKLDLTTDYKFIHDFDTRDRDGYYFYFFGHSLDTSDKEYIDEVFSFLKSSQAEKKKITVIYHDEAARSKLLINLLSIRGKSEIIDMQKNETLVFLHKDSVELENDLMKDLKYEPYI